MLTRNKKLKDYGIPAEDIEKLNAMLKDFPAEYGYLLASAALSACPKNTVIADIVIEISCAGKVTGKSAKKDISR